MRKAIILVVLSVAFAGCLGNDADDVESLGTHVTDSDGSAGADDANGDTPNGAGGTDTDAGDANDEASGASEPDDTSEEGGASPPARQTKRLNETYDLVLTSTRQPGSASTTPLSQNCVSFSVEEAIPVYAATATLTWEAGPTTDALQLRYLVGGEGAHVEGGAPLTLAARSLVITPDDGGLWLVQLPEAGGVAYAQQASLHLMLEYEGEDLTGTLASCAVAGGR